MRSLIAIAMLSLLSACDDPSLEVASAPLDVVTPFATTPPLHQYEDAPRTPDADDPAIWMPRDGSHPPLVIGVLKGGGLQVYDLDGEVVQSLPTARRAPIAADDPPAPGPQPDAGTSPCAGSASGETYGRYNNVAIV